MNEISLCEVKTKWNPTDPPKILWTTRMKFMPQQIKKITWNDMFLNDYFSSERERERTREVSHSIESNHFRVWEICWKWPILVNTNLLQPCSQSITSNILHYILFICFLVCCILAYIIKGLSHLFETNQVIFIYISNWIIALKFQKNSNNFCPNLLVSALFVLLGCA